MGHPTGGPAEKLPSYNERLFGAGLRGWLHQARFRWLSVRLAEHYQRPVSVVELGCFDAKLLGYLEPMFKRYVGLDANWEGGLDLAKARWAHLKNAAFLVCASPAEMPDGERFDVGICMETLEHLPVECLDGYLDRLARITRDRLFITVPNEIGVVCLLKQLAKKAVYEGSPYNWRELALATAGLTWKIQRDEHKGFDYRRFLQELRRWFTVERMDGIPFPFLPPWLNFTVGIVAGVRRETESQGEVGRGGALPRPREPFQP